MRQVAEAVTLKEVGRYRTYLTNYLGTYAIKK